MKSPELPCDPEAAATPLPHCGLVCEQYMREARIIQSSLIPAHSLRHQSVEIAYRFTPFFETGGDFLDFFCLADGHVGLYVGDVVGKGLPATLYGALVMGTLRGIHKTGTQTAEVLCLLNQRLLQRPLPGRFCSTLYAAFNPATRTLTFSNAGLPYPIRASGATCQTLGEGGLPSGMLPTATYQQHAIQLLPGDAVLFATDGLHESRNPDGDEFSSTSLAQVWAQCTSKSADECLNYLFDGLRDFSASGDPHDDVAAVVLKVLA